MNPPNPPYVRKDWSGPVDRHYTGRMHLLDDAARGKVEPSRNTEGRVTVEYNMKPWPQGFESGWGEGSMIYITKVPEKEDTTAYDAALLRFYFKLAMEQKLGNTKAKLGGAPSAPAVALGIPNTGKKGFDMNALTSVEGVRETIRFVGPGWTVVNSNLQNGQKLSDVSRYLGKGHKIGVIGQGSGRYPAVFGDVLPGMQLYQITKMVPSIFGPSLVPPNGAAVGKSQMKDDDLVVDFVYYAGWAPPRTTPLLEALAGPYGQPPLESTSYVDYSKGKSNPELKTGDVMLLGHARHAYNAGGNNPGTSNRDSKTWGATLTPRADKMECFVNIVQL